MRVFKIETSARGHDRCGEMTGYSARRGQEKAVWIVLHVSSRGCSDMDQGLRHYFRSCAVMFAIIQTMERSSVGFGGQDFPREHGIRTHITEVHVRIRKAFQVQEILPEAPSSIISP